MLNHTPVARECQHILIQEISESGDYEYYFSALGPSFGHFERSMRGRKYLLENIEKLEALTQEIKCPACNSIVLEQIKSHNQVIEEIDNAWKQKAAK